MQPVSTLPDMWTYRDRDELGSNVTDTHGDISGFSVEALDGSIGKVDEATYEVGRGHIVVDTGPWIFGKKVILPAGIVRGIDETEELVFVNRTKDEIRHAPDHGVPTIGDETYRELGMYYGPDGAGYRSWDDSV